MRKYAFRILIAVLAVSTALLLAACGEDKELGVPEGCVEISADNVGYDFYMLKGWTSDVESGMTSAYYNDFDTSNVSVMGFDAGDASDAESAWEAALADIESIFTDVAFEEKATDSTLGNRPAKKYVYTAKLGDREFKFMQLVVFAPNNGVFTSMPEIYIFTYTAESSLYDRHIEDVIFMADSMVFEK